MWQATLDKFYNWLTAGGIAYSARLAKEFKEWRDNNG